MDNESQTPDPIAYFLEAQKGFEEDAVALCALLAGQIGNREKANNLKRELQELEADVLLGIDYLDYEPKGKNAEERKAILLQAMAEHPRVEALRKQQSELQAQEEREAVEIERHRLGMSSARARRQFATTLLAYLTTAQDERMAMTPEGAVEVEA